MRPPSSIGLMEEADRDAVAGLLAASALPEIPGGAPIDDFFVSRVNGVVVAAAGLEVHGDAALVRSVVVAPHARRGGLASALVERVLARAGRLDLDAVWLLTTTAAEFFRRFGFVESPRHEAPPLIAESSEFREICPASAVCMRKDLRTTARYFPAGSLDWTADAAGARFQAVALDKTALTYFEVAPRARFERHAHDGEQITWVVDGELWFELDDRAPVVVRAGEAIAIPAHAPHAVATRDKAARAFDAWSPVLPWQRPSRARVAADAFAPDAIRREVKARYAAHALRVVEAPKHDGCCGTGGVDPITRNLYDEMQAGEVPDAALAASLGCGNPTALAELRPGETVLDLGSGGGIDVLLSAKRVGPTGFAYGLDMTDEMLALAEKNRATAGATNVKFLKGHIEEVPLPDAAVDVIVSNCVINLSPDKARVLAEAFRVLRPGGRFAVSDVILQGEFPPEIRRDVESWAGCVAGALEESEYRRLLAAAGFEDVEVQVTRVHDAAELGGSSCCGTEGACGTATLPESSSGRIVSAFVRAAKPAAVRS